MNLQLELPILPEGAEILSSKLAICKDEKTTIFFNASGPIYTCKNGDKTSIRLAGAMLCELGLTTPTVIAIALGVDQSTIHRFRKKYRDGGPEALKHKISKGKRDSYKLKGELLEKAQKLLFQRKSNRETAKEIGVSEGAVRYALRTGKLRGALERKNKTSDMTTPRERSDEDKVCAAGIAVKRNHDRVLASVGKVIEAEPIFVTAESVPMAGVLLGLSALLHQGLLDAGQKVYGNLRNGYYGLRAMLLTLSFMALLRIKTVEQLNSCAPGELGLLLGLDRAPEVKTIRRKLKEMSDRGLSRSYADELTRRWVNEKPDTVGYLYVDGHVRPYHGRKHKLPKTFVQSRRLCMPATTDMWVNDSNADPLFHVTAPVNDGLLSMMNRKILPEVRSLVGDSRRVTMIFDREGWSPKTFERWYKEGFDVLTYRKGKYDSWPDECFIEVKMKVSGKEVVYRLGQRSILLGKKFWMREVRRLCGKGHQTSVMTTRQDLPMEEVAERMFARWRQENFFRYMRQEFAIDHLCTYAMDTVDPDQTIPNPARKKVEKNRAKYRSKLGQLQKKYGELILDKKPEISNKKGKSRSEKLKELEEQISILKSRYEEIKTAVAAIPERIAVKDLPDTEKIKAQERERKVLSDVIKMIAYRAETKLFEVINPFYARHDDEGRNFLKTLFQLPGDLIPDEEGKLLTIRYHSMANRRNNLALKALCEIMSTQKLCYPGTELKMVFEAE